MKKCGIICEYNPLHNGHIKHINAARAGSGCDTVVCVMSGSFVQRAEGAILNKFERAKHAILAGADIVVELPTIFACNSAPDFAFGAVKILDALKCDVLHFGSESGDIDALNDFASFLSDPSAEFQKRLRQSLDGGSSYPAAMSQAMHTMFETNLLKKPNNSLGIEYLKSIKQINSAMRPMTILREDNYNSADLINQFCSATAIRQSIEKEEKVQIKKYVPHYVFDALDKQSLFDNEKLFEFQHGYFSTLTPAALSEISGIEEGLENRFIKYAGEANYEEMMSKVKSKRYTLLKLKRVMLNAVLGITKVLTEKAKTTKPYFRVLAIADDRLDILSDFAECDGISAIKDLTASQKEIYDIDIRANNLYQSLQKQRGNTDFTLPLQKITRPQ